MIKAGNQAQVNAKGAMIRNEKPPILRLFYVDLLT